MENEMNMKKDEESLEKIEEISEEDFNSVETINKNQCMLQDIAVFSPYQIEAIKAMLLTAPAPSSKSMKKIATSVSSSSISSIYNRILESKASNKEIVHYLSIINLYPHPHINLELLVNFKLSFQDKYLGQAVFLYFSIADKYYDSMSFDQKLSLFYRYIYVFSSHMFADFSIFELFCNVLDKDFLSFFVKKQLYHNFAFFKEFLTRFAIKLGDALVKIGYEYPEYRNFIYCTYQAGNNGMSDQAIDWVLQRWNCYNPHSIPYLFYHYDCSAFMKNLAISQFESAIDPIVEINSCLGKCSDKCSICQDKHTSLESLDDLMSVKNSLFDDIKKFNDTGKLEGSLDISFIRLLPSIDIKVLSEFLCKEKNLLLLEKFTCSFDFRDLDLLEALRLYLSSFVMSGESQVINRVLSTFAKVYVQQNLTATNRTEDDTNRSDLNANNIGSGSTENRLDHPHLSLDQRVILSDSIAGKHIDRVKKVAYGFIVINTMLYNPSFEKKPTFDDYLKTLEYNEEYYTVPDYDIFSYDVDDFKAFFDSLKSNEIKIPFSWNDGFDKYLLYKDCITRIRKPASYENYHVYNETNGSKNGLGHDFSGTLSPVPNLEAQARSDHTSTFKSVNYPYKTILKEDICDKCVISSFKCIFSQMSSSFMFLSPVKYFEICQMLDFEAQYGKYVIQNQHDILKCLDSCKIYLTNYKATEDVARIFIDSIEKTEKPKSSVLPDLKSMFAKSSLAAQRSTSTNPQYSQLIDEISSISFKSKEICNHNINILNSISRDRKSYVKQIICKIVLNNSADLHDMCSLDEQLQYTILLTSPDKKMPFASDAIKIKFILNELRSGNISEKYHNIFKNTNLFNDDAFEAFVLFQSAYDDFQDYVSIDLIQDSLTGNYKFAIKEKFEQLSSLVNVLKLCNASRSILNIKTVKKIHRDGCPMNDPVFLSFDKVIYLVLKAGQDKSMIEYVVCLVNFLSDSLVLLIKLFDYMSQALPQISQELRTFLIKILLKRIKIYCETQVSCCEFTSDSDINNKIKNIVNQLYECNYITSNDLKTYQVYVKQNHEIFEL